MNIAIITLVTPAESNGLSNYIRYLLKGLQEIDTKNNYYIVLNRELDSFLDVNKSNFHKILIDIPHHPRFLMRPIFFLWQNLFFHRIIKHYNLDLIHFPNPVPLIFGIKKSCVVTIHDTAEFYSFRNSFLKRQFRILVNKLSAKFADNVITVSNFSKDQINRLLSVNRDDIYVTYPGVALDISNEKEYDTDFEKPYFLFLGGFQKYKNISRVLDAFQKFNQKQNYRLVIIGKGGPIDNSIKKLNLRKNNVYYKESVSEEELIILYKNASVLLYPSLFEGFGLPILEAMSLGIPVITSNRTAMPEVAGNAAILVNPESEQEILEGMIKSQNQALKKELIEKGFKNIQRFDWEATAKSTLIVYEKTYHSFNLHE